MEFPYSRRIFRSNYPLSSRLWNSILEEIQIIFCRFFGNTINKTVVSAGKLGEERENLNSQFESNLNSVNALFNSFSGLKENVTNSGSRS